MDWKHIQQRISDALDQYEKEGADYVCEPNDYEPWWELLERVVDLGNCAYCGDYYTLDYTNGPTADEIGPNYGGERAIEHDRYGEVTIRAELVGFVRLIDDEINLDRRVAVYFVKETPYGNEER